MSLILTALELSAKTIFWSGYEWEVKSGEGIPPGPNNWGEDNVWVDGRLHLKISRQAGRWYCAELHTKESLGFGRYQFQVIGRIDSLDAHVVLGMFSYLEGEGEIDIEVSRFGDPRSLNSHFTVWPPKEDFGEVVKRFAFLLYGTYTTHRFTRTAGGVRFQIFGGHRDDDSNAVRSWNYYPKAPSQRIPQHPMPVYINLWLYHGHPEEEGFEGTELVIKSFKFIPQP